MRNKAEIAVAALAVMFICFVVGYFAGRRSVPSQVSISAGTVMITPTIADADGNGSIALAAETLPPTATPVNTPALQAPAVPEITAEPSVAPPEASAQETTEAPAAPEPTPDPTPAGESHYTAEGLLRINLATQKELETLPGIGEVIASRIIEYRSQNGPFSRLSTLKVIKGIGDTRYADIKDMVTVD